MQALRLARDIGFVVDRAVHERGLKYLRKSQKRDGSFRYALLENRSGPALTAAAITAMHGFGEYYSPAVRRGMEYLRDRYRDPENVLWPFYGHYYAAQAFARGTPADRTFFARTVVPYLVGTQRRDGRLGFWDDADTSHAPVQHGRAYATAMACLALSVPDGLVPLFQR